MGGMKGLGDMWDMGSRLHRLQASRCRCLSKLVLDWLGYYGDHRGADKYYRGMI